MVRAELSSELEMEETENSSSEEEAETPNCNGQKQQEVSEYEKQRLSRIAENKARMEALGISKVASSLKGSPQNSHKRKGKRKVVDGDEDYWPTNDGDGDDDDDDDDDEFLGDKASKSNKRKVKNRSPKQKKKTPDQKQFSSSICIDDEDQLMQAIALSLQHSAEVPGSTVNEGKGNSHIHEDPGRGKRKKSFTSRVQMTEDEVILHFFQFDEAGRGSINTRDLRRVAVAHDFTWTDKDLADMIHCFDSDGDGKLNLDDFRKIVNRCNMIRASENSRWL